MGGLCPLKVTPFTQGLCSNCANYSDFSCMLKPQKQRIYILSLLSHIDISKCSTEEVIATNCDMSVLVYLQIFGGDGLAPCLAGRGQKQKFHFDASRYSSHVPHNGLFSSNTVQKKFKSTTNTVMKIRLQILTKL